MFPSGFSWVFRMRLERNGMMVSDTSSEETTDDMTASGNERMNSPEASGIKASGKKAIASVAVVPTTASVICFVASTAANFLLWPSRSQRSIFSTTTILSSTSKPNATTRPTILS